MITKSNLENVLLAIGYLRDASGKIYEKQYAHFDCSIKVDFNGSGSIQYPEDKGMKITHHTTCNFSDNENFVVLECITRLMDKGYRPEHIELEKEWTLGHDAKGGRADICVYAPNGKTLFIVECKTAGSEYKKEYNNTYSDGGQIFSYWQQERSCKWLSLYASEFNGTSIEYTTNSIDCSDDANILISAKKDPSILLYDNAYTVEELYTVWSETYDHRFCGDVIFRDDSVAYQIGVKPLRKIDLKDFSENDKIVNRFEEILRHNNVSDKENAFNRLIALFICKLVDEIQKGDNDILEFQYKIGTDTYETLQDRLQRLHKEGMEKFMREEIYYVSDNYAENLVQQYTGHKRERMIADLKRTLKILKFYTNNDFAFKDVHNEELFYQNGKILVEVVQLFQEFRIIGSNDVQMLGDLFEQLLNKGFKQNEGQFFTPAPICRFIWDSIPVERILKKDDGIEFPKIIDYACGAGHFLTQGFEAINANALLLNQSTDINTSWPKHKIFGIEKDYRLARVSKISLFMHGAGEGNIIFGDGLENYSDKEITPDDFDILVANPPYSVKAFKPHLKLKDNSFSILDKISNDGSEIETLFVERIAQLVKPGGIAAVILPISILNKENESFISARESLLTNFKIRAIAQFGNKTFGATGTNTIIIFLEKYTEPPKRMDLVIDSINAIFDGRDLSDWEDDDILNCYLSKIGVTQEDYLNFVCRKYDYSHWQSHRYFGDFYNSFITGAEYKTKVKQKNFQKLDDDDKLIWFNDHFYNYTSLIEREKMQYYALVYQQTTLIITAPDDSKGQEQFLGYKWSNRKGQEGIQILSPGGMLYSEDNRFAKDTLSALVRNSFYGKEYSIAGMENYFYYLRLQDMIDFNSITFNKVIKTVKTRALKTTPGLINYKLSDKIFNVTIGDRVLSNEVIDDGSIPIYSANVYEEFGKTNKLKLTDFSVPSILWGIDGDWMVNILPAGQPFYPTDHCGVLRVYSDEIVPEYLALSLQTAGEFEKFSRNNRASVQRIKSLTIQIPEDIDIQHRIVQEIEAIDIKYNTVLGQINSLNELLKDKFLELFGSPENNFNNYDICTVQQAIDMGYIEKPLDGNHGEKHPKTKDFVSDGVPFIMANNLINGSVDIQNCAFITEEQARELDKGFSKDGDVLLTHKGTIGRTAILHYPKEFVVLTPQVTYYRPKSGITATYLKGYFDSSYFQNSLKTLAGDGSTRPYVGITAQLDLVLLIPPENKQEDYVLFAENIQAEIQQHIKEINKLKQQKKELIVKYFH